MKIWLFHRNYLFVYASDKNNVVVLIQPSPDSSDTPELDIPEKDMVDTMGYDMLEVMGWKMVRYVMTLILDLGRNMKWMMTINICIVPLKKIIEINYKCEYIKRPMVKFYFGGQQYFYL